MTPRFFKYALVGAAATAIHYAWLVSAVHAWHWPAPWAAGSGAAIGAQVAFVGNRQWAFGHQGAWLAAWWRFQATAVFSMLLSSGGVALGVALGLHYLLAQALATLLGLVLTYAINRRWAFR